LDDVLDSQASKNPNVIAGSSRWSSDVELQGIVVRTWIEQDVDRPHTVDSNETNHGHLSAVVDRSLDGATTVLGTLLTKAVAVLGVTIPRRRSLSAHSAYFVYGLTYGSPLLLFGKSDHTR
ncbi:hypothetical protein M752DRAFT_270576, partial [Aspergillus phoenicis ATCC 13157]